MNRKSVFIISVGLLIFISIWGVFSPNTFQNAVTTANNFITTYFTQYYLLVMSLFVVFSIVLLIPKFGKVRLGSDDSRPEYSNLSWFAMLFSAGMGIGLVFWGVAEPVSHFIAPQSGIEPGSSEAVAFAFQKSFLHWGLHPWAGYVVIGGSLAYMQYRKQLPGLISSLLIPIIGEKKARGKVGQLVDIIAIFATVAGIVTSLGLGAYQINSGLNYLFNIPENNSVLFLIVAITTILFIITAVSGVNKGIKLLSNVNVWLALLIMVLTFIVGPTVLIIKYLGIGIFEYITNLTFDMLPINVADNKEWLGQWTIVYWAWWIAWAPFVGSFIARISKGRTIREFVIGVLFAPLVASMVWFAIFGTVGINLGPEVATGISQNVETAVFQSMNFYRLGSLISAITVVLLFTFFITSANSGTFVLGIFSSEGNLNPSTKKKVVWGLLITTVTLVLMFASSQGLENVQIASKITALPFSIIMIIAMISWIKSLLKE